MFDLIGALCLSASATIVCIVIVSAAAIRREAKIAAFAVAAAWLATLVALGASGRSAPSALGVLTGVPGMFTLAVTAGAIAWFTSARLRAALLSVPLAALVGVHALRVIGVFFLLLWAGGRLSAPFAPFAGIGDILVGLEAIVIATLLTRGRTVSHRVIRWWNAFGTLDLALAVTLGVLSTPGLPIQRFGSAASFTLTTLPWFLVPTFLVPFYLLMHLTIATRLAHEPAHRAAFAG
ncbi:MAG: hypothetical protein ABR975_01595 [Vulcanimicrobiaceae bacterium]|jgi:hypothetical protein